MLDISDEEIRTAVMNSVHENLVVPSEGTKITSSYRFSHSRQCVDMVVYIPKGYKFGMHAAMNTIIKMLVDENEGLRDVSKRNWRSYSRNKTTRNAERVLETWISNENIDLIIVDECKYTRKEWTFKGCDSFHLVRVGMLEQ